MKFYTNVVQWGNNILVREYKNGERINHKVKYSPTLFVPVQKQTGFHTLDGDSVMPYSFDTIKESKNFISQYKNQPHLVYGFDRYAYTYVSDTYPSTVGWSSDKIYIATIDIEVKSENGFPDPEKAEEEMLSITIKNQSTKDIVVWGIGDFHNEREDVTYVKCDDETDLLSKFLGFWSADYPDIITGWNTEFFDMPYLVNRIRTVLGEDKSKELSPWGIVNARSVYSYGRDQQIYDIFGVGNIDYLQLYRKFTYTNQESYSLDHIASVELGEKKLENPFDTFRDWYTNDYQSFIEYNIVDVELVDRIDEKMKLMELLLTMAYDAKVNYEDIFGTVKYWDVMIYNFLKRKNIVIPQKKFHDKPEKFEGGYVKDPHVGQHDWVVSFDLNSLYPHLIMQYNISPETLVPSRVKGLTVDNMLEGKELSIPDSVTVTPNGAMFSKDRRGFLPELMSGIYNDRTTYKKKMLQAKQDFENTKDKKYLNDISRYNNIQMAKKISLNSAYGAIGNQWFRYYDLAIAEGITTAGQLSIRWIEKKVNEYLNKLLETDNKDYVIAADTDSIYVTLDGLVSKVFKEGTPTGKIVDFLDKVAEEKLESFIDKSYKDLAGYVSAYEQKMFMKREVIADKGIWTAKKRYILNAWDVEGVRYNEPQLKIMGIEAVKSSTPAPCRVKIKEALKIIMTGDSGLLNEFLQQFRKEFDLLSPEEIAYPRSTNGLKKYGSDSSIYRKGTPMHIKGALIHNHMLSERGLGGKYPSIRDGDKCKFIQLRQPNPLGANVISFLSELPKELDIHRYIDYDIQFEKSFIEPLIFITDKLQWHIDRSYGTQTSLEGFFS